MSDEEQSDFDSWAAGLYARDLTFMETVGGLCFPLLVVCLVVLSPAIWLGIRIKRLFP